MRSPTDAVRREIVVRAPKERAFEVFTAGIDRWWPRKHHIGDADLDEVIIEPREGGRWYARHVDGSESNNGYVMAWEPHDRLALAWQITHDWKFDPMLVTTIDVRFVSEAPDRTRVELEHRDLDRYGPQAETMKELFARPDAWAGTLEAFAAVAESG